jgi:high-affinity nickel-transport protein
MRTRIGPGVRIVMVVAALFLLSWGSFLFIVLPGHFTVGGGEVFGWGLALTAFGLGVRHAFDADHIAAIDNTTRKLVNEGTPAVSVGFWFALGHSTVVVVTVALLSAGLKLVIGLVSDDSSALAAISGIWGPAISGLFLLLIGTLNLSSLAGIHRAFRTIRSGSYSEAELEGQLARRGVMARVLRPFADRIDAPWKMYPVGLLFGLGFDTATTIALFAVGGGTSLVAPWYVVMALPLLFTAGMTLFDTLDGLVMHHSYAWAYSQPLRRVYYSLTITAMSIAIAFSIGGLSLLGLFAGSLTEGPLAWLAALDTTNLGFVVGGVLIATWLASVGYWQLTKSRLRLEADMTLR